MILCNVLITRFLCFNVLIERISVLRNYLKYIYVSTIYNILYTKCTEYLEILPIDLTLCTFKKCQRLFSNNIYRY